MNKSLLIICVLFWAFTLNAQNVSYRLYKNYMGRFVPNFDTLGLPDETGFTDCINLEGIPYENNDHYAMQMEYAMKVNRTDTFTFRLCSDDGSMLYIDGRLLIDDNGEHGPVYIDKDILLTKGVHQIRIDYFEFHRSQSLSLFCKNSTYGFRQVGLENSKGKPSFVKPQLKEASKRMKQWIGKDAAVVFPIVTDVHTCNRETYRHIGYMAEASGRFGYDVMVNLGDIGLNTEPAHSSKEYADLLIQHTLDEMAKYKGVWLYAPGNHDFDGGLKRHITSAELSDMFQKPSLPQAKGNLHLTEGNTWSYYDIPEKHMRFILLNSEDGERLDTAVDYTYGKEQLEWLIRVLQETPEQYSVLVMSHFMPHEVGRFGGRCKQDSTIDALRHLLSAYALKGSGSEIGLDWDFTHAQGRLVGMFAGDSHVNALVREDGVNYFITQGYGGMENGNIRPECRRAWYNSRHSLCCDVIVIKPEKGEVHTFRVGAGGAEMDYSFTY